MSLPLALQSLFDNASFAANTPTLMYHLHHRMERLRHAINAAPPNVSWTNTFALLRQHGLSAGPLGIQLARGFLLPDEMRAQQALAAALALLVFVDSRPALGGESSGNSGWARHLYTSDARVLRTLPHSPPATPATRGRDLLSDLLEDGFARVQDFGLNATALSAQAWAELAANGMPSRRGDLITSRAALPALEPLLHNESLAKVIRGYLGGSARFDGYATFQLTPKATTGTCAPAGLDASTSGFSTFPAVLLPCSLRLHAFLLLTQSSPDRHRPLQTRQAFGTTTDAAGGFACLSLSTTSSLTGALHSPLAGRTVPSLTTLISTHLTSRASPTPLSSATTRSCLSSDQRVAAFFSTPTLCTEPSWMA